MSSEKVEVTCFPCQAGSFVTKDATTHNTLLKNKLLDQEPAFELNTKSIIKKHNWQLKKINKKGDVFLETESEEKKST